MAVGKVVAHLCLTLFIKEMKISVGHDRVVTTLNIIFSVVRYITMLLNNWLLKREKKNHVNDHDFCGHYRSYSLIYIYAFGNAKLEVGYWMSKVAHGVGLKCWVEIHHEGLLITESHMSYTLSFCGLVDPIVISSFGKVDFTYSKGQFTQAPKFQTLFLSTS